MLSFIRSSLLLSLLIFALFLCFSFYRMHAQVKDVSMRAKNVIAKDCVPSLIEYYNSIYCVPDDRVKVIWALGQLADEKALPFLYQIDSTYQCEGYDTTMHMHWEICYETRKAIKGCSQGNNTSWLYYNRKNW